MNEFSRRLFLAGAGAAALPLPATAQPAQNDMLIVNALGGFSNPNAPRAPVLIQGTRWRPLPLRVLADARASGMNAVNVTLGYVAGDMEPFEHSVREIGVWEARLRHHSSDLTKVLTAADILRARQDRKIGVIFGFQNAAMMGTDASRVRSSPISACASSSSLIIRRTGSATDRWPRKIAVSAGSGAR